MSSETKNYLEDFAARVNWNRPGDIGDMERFRDFTISAYRHSEGGISFDEFVAAAGGRAKSEGEGDVRDPKAVKKKLNFLMYMFDKYEEGINLLRRFENK